ncbi:SSU ribosomal protein S9p (S16e) [hydrothermal vent metagenome]|uniref:SSU ribosomal protein S9p (S16e) n=1 Tax=hydrothermal vent metagenome TaxID=652676 RepID=A0A3B1E1R4_9ZZZZ
MAEDTTEPVEETVPETPAAETPVAETATEETVVVEAPVGEAVTEEVPADETAVTADGTELTLGSGDPADTEEEVRPRPKPIIRGKIDKFGTAMGTGRRKTSVARVRLKSGNGAFTINGRSFEEFLTLERDQKMVQAPLAITEQLGKLDVWVRVNGGGTTGQTGAIVLGIARALQAVDPELHYKLADAGFLTRDSRMVERKKYGFKKARKSFQFSKR